MAVINSPPETMVDDAMDSSGNPIDGAVNSEWRNFFMAAYNVCFSVTSSGTTALRPTQLLWTGRPYFDTTLGLPIWYKTAGWVNATGASV